MVACLPETSTTPSKSAYATVVTWLRSFWVLKHTCELCSWRGLASLPSLPMGELMRRRCDSVEA